MSEFIRLRDKRTGHQISAKSDLLDIDPDRYERVAGGAVDQYGKPLPPKFSRHAAALTSPEVTVAEGARPGPRAAGANKEGQE